MAGSRFSSHRISSRRSGGGLSPRRLRMRRRLQDLGRGFGRWLPQGGTSGWKRWTLRLVAIGGVVGLGYAAFLWFTLPDISDHRSFLAAESTVITDRNGVELYRLFQEEDRTEIEGELIPQYMKQAIIAIEDERFYERGCLDMQALARVFFRFGQAGGASTLTRQLARNALDLKGEHLLNRKLKELILGCQMEGQYSKDELLSLYLNWIPFGQNAYGIEQASQVYFGSSAEDLTLAQSSVLAALPQRPTYFSPYGSHRFTTVTGDIEEAVLRGDIVRANEIPDDAISIGLLGAHIGTGTTTVYIGGRTDQVLQNMQNQGYVTEQERLMALEELQNMVFEPSREDIRAPHFVLWVREQVEEMFVDTQEEGLLERGGFTVQTTIDWEVQRIAEEVVADHKEDILDRFGAHNAALIAVDPVTREILAYVGNTDYVDEEHGGKIDMARVPRQPGSSFKPFVYAAAFEEGFGPATVLYDVKTQIGTDEPQNFDGRFWGPTSIREALGASRNIPAAKAYFLAGGEDDILQLIASMGAETPLVRKRQLAQERADGFDYGWPLALGAAETPPIEMVHAYSAFAGGGEHLPLVSIKRILNDDGSLFYEAEEATPTRVLDERIAYQITSILSDESVRPDEYWRSQLSTPGYQTAAKTGTSNKCLEWGPNGVCRLRKPDNAWVLGYTPALVAGVWVGNADSSALFDRGGGLNTASPIWKDFMVRAHRELPVGQTTFSVPSGLVQPQISGLSGQLPAECTPVDLRRADIFLKENAPSEPDPACATLLVDKVTGLLASDACPVDAQEEGHFFVPRSIQPERWPQWEAGVQNWVAEQVAIWEATDTHSGSLLPLPVAPTEECDPSLTPGRLVEPTVKIVSPSEGGLASYPAFVPDIDFEVGSSVRELRVLIDGRRAAIETEPPFRPTVRVPRSINQSGTHELTVELTDEYYNVATDTVTFRFGEDTGGPDVRLRLPQDGQSFAVGDTVRMLAEASDEEGAVRYVQFYLDDLLLSNRPVEPYELRYELDVEPGRYRIRAVAEDIAGLQSEDSAYIVVTGEDGEIPTSTTDADEPSILVPLGSTNLSLREPMEIVVVTPRVGGNLRKVRLTVRHDQTTNEDELLSLSSGDGTYRRTWEPRRPGIYSILLFVTDGTGTEEVIDRRTVTVEN